MDGIKEKREYEAEQKKSVIEEQEKENPSQKITVSREENNRRQRESWIWIERL